MCKKTYYKLVTPDGDNWYYESYEDADRTRYIFGGTILSVQGRECPVCGEVYVGYPALSRKDNKTLICPACGLNEAMAEILNNNREVK